MMKKDMLECAKMCKEGTLTTNIDISTVKDRNAGGFLIGQPMNVETSRNFISRTLILFTNY
jgi:hypothetical protein